MIQREHCAAIIPCLNEESAIAPLVAAVRQQLPAVLVINDGSRDRTAGLAEQAGALVISHPRTRGKGAALRTGCRAAIEQGFDWAVLMDGDGQHSPEDIPAFFERVDQAATALIVGNRMADAAQMPWIRRWVNRWMSARLSRLAGRCFPDSQCGFRLVSLRAWSALALQTTHFEVESEMLLAFAAAGHGIEFVPIQTLYKNEQSKIHPIRDTVRWFRWWGSAKDVAQASAPASSSGVSPQAPRTLVRQGQPRARNEGDKPPSAVASSRPLRVEN